MRRSWASARRQPRRPTELAHTYRTRVYPDYAALLNDVDVIDICTPTHLHHEMVLQAAAAGKHIICEKPLARTVTQAQEMIRVCRNAGVRLFVAHVVRFFPEYALAKAQVQAGKVGKPAVVRLSRGSYRPKKPSGNWFLDIEKSGGMMLDLMIHDFDYARWISGEVESVFAKNVSTLHPDVGHRIRHCDFEAYQRCAVARRRRVGLSTADVSHQLRDRRRWWPDRMEFGQHRADQFAAA